MYQNLMLAIVIAILALIVFKVYQSWQKQQSLRPMARRRSHMHAGHDQHAVPVQPFHAVSLVGDCDALKPLEGKRFLARKAPTLPVPNCKAERCHCRYQHYEDRRDPRADRRGGLDERYFLDGKGERRHSKGRRKSDGWGIADQWGSAI